MPVANSGRRCRVKASPPIEPAEQALTLPDGTKLFYRAWLPPQPTDKALILFHRGHEHSGRLVDVVEQLNLDRRGLLRLGRPGAWPFARGPRLCAELWLHGAGCRLASSDIFRSITGFRTRIWWSSGTAWARSP